MPVGSSSAVVLTPPVIAALRAHAERAYPEECCGALVVDASGAVQVRELDNVAVDRRHGFEVSARSLLALERGPAALLGFYHSHPDAPSEPSARDAETARVDVLTVIVPVVRGVAGAPRAFRFDDRTRRFTGQ